jgi:hypothetical protein
MMIREIIIPTEDFITIQLPKEFIGKEIEVIAFELKNTKRKFPKKSIDDLKRELDGLTTSMKDFKFDRDEANDYD